MVIDISDTRVVCLFPVLNFYVPSITQLLLPFRFLSQCKLVFTRKKFQKIPFYLRILLRTKKKCYHSALDWGKLSDSSTDYFNSGKIASDILLVGD
jgi:hypothetical protein